MNTFNLDFIQSMVGDFQMQATIETIGWTLIHSLWQGAAIGIMFGVLLIALSRCSANLRYCLSVAGLILLAVCPIATFLMLSRIDSNLDEPMLARADELANQQIAESPVDQNNWESSNTSTYISSNAMNSNAITSNGMTLDTQGSMRTSDNEVSEKPISAYEPASSDSISNKPSEANLRFWIESVRARLTLVIPWFVGTWLLGVLLLSLRLFASWYRVQKIKSGAVEIKNHRLNDQFKALAKNLGLKRTAQLLESSIVRVPTVIGWLKPAILLPGSAITGLSTSQLSAILAHELAHVRRADYVVNLVQTSIETVLFFHPMVWWLSRRIRIERENCCDDLAAQVCGNRTDLARALLVLEQSKPSHALALGADGASLVDRVSRLLGRTPTRQSMPVWMAGFGSFGIALATIGIVVANQPNQVNEIESVANVVEDSIQDQDGEKSDAKKVEIEEPIMVVMVVDEDGNPLKDVNLQTGIWTPTPIASPNGDYTTDENGQATVKLYKEHYIVRVWARAEGYVPLFSNWEEAEIKNGDGPPAEFTIQMVKGSEIGGIIKNSKGEAITGARVQVMAKAEHPSGKRRPRYGTWYAEGDEALTTDSEGRWSLGNLPPEDNYEINTFVAHPDYIDDESWGGMQKEQKVTFEQFREKTATIVMRQGVKVRGTIKDGEGKPVVNALVVWGDDPYMEQDSQETQTGLEGEFELASLPEGEMRLTVMAPGFQPEMKMVELSEMMDSIDFELKPGKMLKFLVLDSDGKPVPEVYVGIRGWRGVESLYNHRHPNVIDSTIPNRGDEGGLYQWSWAPEDEVTFGIGKQGYMHIDDLKLKASEELHIVTLPKQLAFSGLVTDQKTKKPIPFFKAIPLQLLWPKRMPFRAHEQRDEQVQGQMGQFIVPVSRGDVGHKVMIEAPGYRTVVTEMFMIGDKIPQLNIELEPAPVMRGKILDLEGNPAKEIQVLVASNNQNISIDSYQPNGMNEDEKYTTNSRGGFEMPAKSFPFTLIAYNNDGYVEKDFGPDDKIGELQLQKWATIGGTTPIFDEGIGTSVSARPIRFHEEMKYHVQDGTFERFDDRRTFQLTKIPPGKGSFGCRGRRDRDQVFSRWIPYDLKPGEHLNVEIGDGVNVSGRVQVKGHNGNLHRGAFHLVHLKPGIEPNEALKKYGFRWQDGWIDPKTKHGLNETEPGRVFAETLFQDHLYIESDGSFNIQFLPVGNYELDLELQKGIDEGEGSTGQEFVSTTHRFSVSAEDLKNGMLDLGTIDVEQKPSIKLGDAVPDFAFKIDGEDANSTLTGFRGKVVVIDFYADYCEVCKSQMDQVSELVSAHKENENIQFLSFKTQPRQDAREDRVIPGKPGHWRIAKLDADTGDATLDLLAIWTVPTVVIVDGEGKLAYRGTLDGAAAFIENMIR